MILLLCKFCILEPVTGMPIILFINDPAMNSDSLKLIKSW